MAQPLQQVQYPPSKPTAPPKDWKGIVAGFQQNDTYLRVLIQYLQQSGLNLQQYLVPPQIPVAQITQAQSPYSPDPTIGSVAVTASATMNVTVNLPAASGSGRILIVYNNGTHNVVINANGSDTINGSSSETLSSQYSVLRLQDTETGLWNLW